MPDNGYLSIRNVIPYCLQKVVILGKTVKKKCFI